jgi:hypothetical protein
LLVAVSALVGVGTVSARAVAGSITLDGTPVTATVATPGDTARFNFSSRIGVRVFAEITGSTFGPDCPAAELSLVGPNNKSIGSSATCGATAVLDTRTLDHIGTWSLRVDAPSGDVGSATLRAWSVPADTSAAITLDAPATAVALATGQNGSFTFTPSVGQKVTAALGGASFTGACPDVAVALLRPDGTQAANATTCSDSAFVDATTIDQAGTWTALVDPQSDGAGSGSLAVFDVTDQQAGTSVNGGAVGVALSRPGQNGDYAFAGTAGQKVSATVASATFSGCPGYALSLVRPDGTTLGSSAQQCGNAGFLDGQVLDQSGNWVVRVDPQGAATGTGQLSVFDATDQVRSVKVGGPAVPANLLKPGQNSYLQFDGTAGEQVAARVTGATFAGSCPTFALSLVRPDGSTLGAPVTSCTDAAQLPAQTLDQTGTWSYLVDGRGPATGTATVEAFEASSDSRAITLNGARLNFNLTSTEDGDFFFSGTRGQKVSAAISGATFTGCPGYTLGLQRPDGSQLGTPVDGCAADELLDSRTLDQTGTWTFVVHPVGAAVQGTIQGYTFTDLKETADLSGKSIKLIFKHPGQNAMVSFAGKAGQQVSAVVSDSSVTGSACPTVVMKLVRPGGAVRGGPVTTCTDSAFRDTVKLDLKGTWRLVIDPQGTSTGTLHVQVFTVVDDVRPLPVNGLRSFTAQQPGADGVFRFKGTKGQVRRVTVSSSTFAGCPGVIVSFLRPNGSVFATTNGCASGFVLGPVTLDANGSWTVLVDPQGPGEGTMILKLTS